MVSDGAESRYMFSYLEAVELLPNSVIGVRRNPNSDSQERYGNMFHEAEIFHLNSRISKGVDVNRPLPVGYKQMVSDWLHETSYSPKDAAIDFAVAGEMGMIVSEAPKGDKLLKFLLELSRANPYGLDRFALLENNLYILRNGRLWFDKTLSKDELTNLRECICLESGYKENLCALFFVGFPWRYMAMQGPRGYRHLLVELGRDLHSTEKSIENIGLTAISSLDFWDSQAGEILGFDGVEAMLLASTLVVS